MRLVLPADGVEVEDPGHLGLAGVRERAAHRSRRAEPAHGRAPSQPAQVAVASAARSAGRRRRRPADRPDRAAPRRTGRSVGDVEERAGRRARAAAIRSATVRRCRRRRSASSTKVEVVPAGEDPDPAGGTARAAGGAGDAVEQSGGGRSRGSIGRQSTEAPVRHARPARRSIPPGGIGGCRRPTGVPSASDEVRPPMSPTDGPSAGAAAGPEPLPPQLLQGQGPARPAPVADGGPGPRHRPDDRARGVLRRHPAADRRPAGRRRRAVDPRPRGPRQGCVRTAAEQGKADEYVDEVIDVVRRTLGRPVRGSARSS